MPELQQKRMRQLREQRGYSQESFVDACGLHRTYIGSVERGERNLTLSSLRTIAKTLKVTMSELLKGID